tara:strand:+ start:50 stop:1156 length:1107 start_codon:yes stop_codon:yes gene_type:complete
MIQTTGGSTKKTLLDCDDAWDQFLDDNYDEEVEIEETEDIDVAIIPKCSEIYISTKTKIAYLNKSINLKETFWKIPVLDYSKPENGVIKKQIKYSFQDVNEVNNIEEKLKKEVIVEQQQIQKINNPEGKVKFKDIRKISVGTCKKDILSYRSKKKSAFYNCFVLILRIFYDDEYKECHVKVFNTGKLELPGIQSKESLRLILRTLVKILNDSCGLDIGVNENQKSETVLINSNFTCNYFIDREKLVDILKQKYHLNTTYDPCSYPGIMSKFYYDTEKNIQDGTEPAQELKKKFKKRFKEVSFMIFRTGSVLIVGKCESEELMKIYEYLKKVLHDEYINVRQVVNAPKKIQKKAVKRKVRRKTIIFKDH